MPALLWFRRDLRLGDHPGLIAAADNQEVLACFVLDPRLEASSAGDGCNSWVTRCGNCETTWTVGYS
jgi:deoxyribodipyrimidine photolyase